MLEIVVECPKCGSSTCFTRKYRPPQSFFGGQPTDMDALTVTCGVCGWSGEEKTKDWSPERVAEVDKNMKRETECFEERRKLDPRKRLDIPERKIQP